ncbi:MAG: S41 family peptidase [bacterium]
MNRRSFSFLAVLAGIVVLGGSLAATAAYAQFAGPPGNQPDMTVDTPTRHAVIETLATQFERTYIFEDKARASAAAVRHHRDSGRYDRIGSAAEFADSLSAHLRAVTSDLHVCVFYRNEPFPIEEASGEMPEAERRRHEERARYTNYGFERVERLPGNVGYLDLREFSSDTDGLTTAAAAMNFLANTDALIVDLRRNGGGSPSMIAMLLTYLTPEGTREHINDFYRRAEDVTEQFWTLPHVPGARLAGKPLYVLTSGYTFSAAEEFSYDVQNMRLGTIVGEVTGGGAHPVDFVRLHDHFAASIPFGRAINPVTGTNWEGVGVKPEVEVAAAEALRTAHVAAVKKLAENPENSPERREILARALERAEATATAASDDFAPPGLAKRAGKK